MISMKKTNGGRNRVPHILLIVLVIVITLIITALLPFDFQVKKLLFFILIILFFIAGVLVMNNANKRK